LTKQRLEGDFTKLLKTGINIWWQRFYHVMGRYTSVPGDFLVLSKDKNILVECKECTRGVFTFDRLTQKRDLMKFKASFPHHKAYILFCFWNNKIIDSDYFLVDIDEMVKFINESEKKSANLKDFLSNFESTPYSDLLIYILQNHNIYI